MNRSSSTSRGVRLGFALFSAALLASCAIGPKYKRPDLTVPGGFKSAPGPTASGAAATESALLPGNWWTLFNDAALNQLTADALAANQDIKAAIARIDESRDALRATAGGFFPSLDVVASARRSRSSSGTISTNYSLPLDLGYELDVWGRLRRQYEAAHDTALASVDDAAVVRQTIAADVAQSYFTLRLFENEAVILQEALNIYQQEVDLTNTKYNAGIALPTDVLQARTQLNNATNQLLDLKRSRARQEHALAILLGLAPSAFNPPTSAFNAVIPSVPSGIPVSLLSRRPDVAESELKLAAANAQIGIAETNFFPSFSLSGSAGFQSSAIGDLVDWEKRVWSIGPSISVPLFHGGTLSANLAQARARYEELVANYRKSVLVAFQDVEDELSDLDLLGQKAVSLAQTLVSARENARLTGIQYQQGLTGYLQVLTANQTLLSTELSNAQTQNDRLTASVLLIKALGGGWSVAK